jgi:hypothetical protein
LADDAMHEPRQNAQLMKEIGFNDPPVIFDTISSVTFAFSLGENQEGWMAGRPDFWA